jgi:hypothetical protein
MERSRYLRLDLGRHASVKSDLSSLISTSLDVCIESHHIIDDASSGWVRGEREMKRAILEGGPITSFMWIPPTFRDFKGEGVYVPSAEDQAAMERDSNKKKGERTEAEPHIVQVVGWGVEKDNPRQKNVPYWVIVNTWGLRYKSIAEARNEDLVKGKTLTLTVRPCTAGIRYAVIDDRMTPLERANYQRKREELRERVSPNEWAKIQDSSTPLLSKVKLRENWNWFKPFTMQFNSQQPDGYLEYYIVSHLGLANKGTVELHAIGATKGTTQLKYMRIESSSTGFISMNRLMRSWDSLEKDPSNEQGRVIYAATATYGFNGQENSPYLPTLKIHRGAHSQWSNGEIVDAVAIEYNASFFAGGITVLKDSDTTRRFTLKELIDIKAKR